MMNEGLWEFSLRVYALPGVAEACLELQDRSGADVNLLLFALFAAELRRRLDSEAFRLLDAAVCRWREDVVRPLRSVRRALKAMPAGSEGGEALGLRDLVKRAELDAERLEQSRLEALLPEGVADDDAALSNVDAYAVGSGIHLERAVVTRLLSAAGF
jgi:uncharacterized protein (TIGR02444 family)